jgi:hypothetical protein
MEPECKWPVIMLIAGFVIIIHAGLFRVINIS